MLDRAQNAHVRLSLAALAAATCACHDDALLRPTGCLGAPGAARDHELVLCARVGLEPVVGRRKLVARVGALRVLLFHALFEVCAGLAANARDAVVKVVQRAALQLGVELAAALRGMLLRRGDVLHLRSDVHEQLH